MMSVRGTSTDIRWREAFAYVRGSTQAFIIFPIGYGILTLVFGDELWGAGRLYDAAMVIPFAPESWGVLALVFGILMAIGEFSERKMFLSVGCAMMGIWCYTFAALFLIDCLRYETPFGAPEALLYSVIGTHYWGRSRLALKWR